MARELRIVVGYDGSPAARRALERAADLAGGGVVNVVSVAHSLYRHPYELADPAEVERARQLLTEAGTLVAGRDVAAELHEPVGDPARKLVETAEELGADVLVVGRRDGAGLRHAVLGSVSAAAMERAPCDVLVVR